MMNREKQKKEQKTFEYIENPEQIEGFDKIPVPEDLDQRVRAGIEEGEKETEENSVSKNGKSWNGNGSCGGTGIGVMYFQSIFCSKNATDRSHF